MFDIYWSFILIYSNSSSRLEFDESIPAAALSFFLGSVDDLFDLLSNDIS